MLVLSPEFRETLALQEFAQPQTVDGTRVRFPQAVGDRPTPALRKFDAAGAVHLNRLHLDSCL